MIFNSGPFHKINHIYRPLRETWEAFLLRQQLVRLCLQGLGDPGDYGHGGVSNASLDAGDVSPVKFGFQGEFFLRQTSFLPKPPHIPSYDLPNVLHAARSRRRGQ